MCTCRATSISTKPACKHSHLFRRQTPYKWMLGHKCNMQIQVSIYKQTCFAWNLAEIFLFEHDFLDCVPWGSLKHERTVDQLLYMYCYWTKKNWKVRAFPTVVTRACFARTEIHSRLSLFFILPPEKCLPWWEFLFFQSFEKQSKVNAIHHWYYLHYQSASG